MKKLAALSLAVIAGAASASTISVQTGAYAGTTNSSTTAADFQSIVTGDPALTPQTPASWVWDYGNLHIDADNSVVESKITFDVTTAGTWSFRAGVDFGGGGAMLLDGVALDSKTNDMWWNYSYADASQFLAGSANLSVGQHTLTLYGVENCCSGNQQTQFMIGNSGTYSSFGLTDGLLPAVPEAQTYAMLLAGLGLVATLARRRRQG